MPMKGNNEIKELDIRSIDSDSEVESMAWIDNDLSSARDLYRVRTHSIPSLSYKMKHSPARRATSASTATNLAIHSNEWYLKTQELFRALRFSDQSQNKQSKHSSRLTSHHSSSSEEWYSEFNNIETSIKAKGNQLDVALLERRISKVSEELSDCFNDPLNPSDRTSVSDNNHKALNSCDESLQLNNKYRSDSVNKEAAQETKNLMHDNNNSALNEQTNQINSSNDNKYCPCFCTIM
jgi:hypothetical protein